jgi:hypothetical protein
MTINHPSSVAIFRGFISLSEFTRSPFAASRPTLIFTVSLVAPAIPEEYPERGLRATGETCLSPLLTSKGSRPTARRPSVAPSDWGLLPTSRRTFLKRALALPLAPKVAGGFATVATSPT